MYKLILPLFGLCLFGCQPPSPQVAADPIQEEIDAGREVWELKLDYDETTHYYVLDDDRVIKHFANVEGEWSDIAAADNVTLEGERQGDHITVKQITVTPIYHEEIQFKIADGRFGGNIVTNAYELDYFGPAARLN